MAGKIYPQNPWGVDREAMGLNMAEADSQHVGEDGRQEGHMKEAGSNSKDQDWSP